MRGHKYRYDYLWQAVIPFRQAEWRNAWRIEGSEAGSHMQALRTADRRVAVVSILRMRALSRLIRAACDIGTARA